MSDNIKRKTSNCIICGNKDTIMMSGHVHNGDEIVFAQFCEEHSDSFSTNKECKGCYGNLPKDMPIEDSGIFLGYIQI